MKSILFVPFLLLALSLRDSGEVIESISVKAEITGRAKSNECAYLEGDIFFTRIEVKNISDSKVSFWIMRCSWFSSWTFDTKDARFCSPGCDSNYPIEIRLESGKSIIFYGVVHPDLQKVQEAKLGFAMISFDEFLSASSSEEWAKLFKSHKIYWSNTVSFKYWNNQYKIQE